jgi:hypothetical protein
MAAAVSIVWSLGRSNTLTSVTGLALGLVVVTAIVKAFSPEEIEARLRRYADVIVLLSVAVAPVVPMVGTRVAGIFANPNTVGLMIALLLPWVLVGRKFWSPMPLLTIGLLVASGSRAGLAAVAVQVLVLTLRGRHRLILKLGAAMAVGVLLLAASGQRLQTSTAEIRRRDDSRTSTWLRALPEVGARPLGGTGYGAEEVDVANSYLKLAVELGGLGILCGLPPLLLAVARTRRSSTAASLAIVGGLVNAVFESWLFAGGTVYFLLFWLQVELAAPRHARAVVEDMARA